MISPNSCPNSALKRLIFKLRQYREEAGCSQKEAAERLNIGHRSYQRIENGEASCDVCFLHRFSLVFNIDFLELVSPYPPEVLNLTLYREEEELKKFEHLPFVQQSQFMDWVNRIASIEQKESSSFFAATLPMAIGTPNKKFFNAELTKTLDIEKSSRRVNYGQFLGKERMNYFDCLFYYRPRYSLKRKARQLIRGINYRVEIYSAHIYMEDEILTLSLFSVIP